MGKVLSDYEIRCLLNQSHEKDGLLTQEDIDSILGYKEKETIEEIVINKEELKEIKEDIQDIIGMVCSSIENNKRCLSKLKEMKKRYKV